MLQVAKPQAVMNILKQAYGDNKAAVNDELVQMVLEPGLQVHLLIWSRFELMNCVSASNADKEVLIGWTVGHILRHQ